MKVIISAIKIVLPNGTQCITSGICVLDYIHIYTAKIFCGEEWCDERWDRRFSGGGSYDGARYCEYKFTQKFYLH